MFTIEKKKNNYVIQKKKGEGIYSCKKCIP